MMYIEHIQKLNLPMPKAGECQIAYIKRLLLNGYRLDTRQCRYIGIGNLHSLISSLNKQRFPHVVEHKKVIDPNTGKIPPHCVDVVYMTMTQRQALEVYQTRNAQPKPSV